MAEQQVTLPMLEACLATKRRRLAFPPMIEALYDRQMESYRQKIMAKGVLPTVVIYNVFLVADYLLLPQTFLLAVILHFALVTPLILAAAYLYPRARSQWLREVTVAIIPLMIVAQIMFIYSLNEGAGANHYQYLAVMIVIYMNVILNLGFRIALATTLLVVAAYLGVVLPGHSPFEVKFLGTSLMVSAAYLSLMASRRMEQDLRFNFLRRQRDQMRREGAEEVAKRDALTGLANRRAGRGRSRPLGGRRQAGLAGCSHHGRYRPLQGFQ